MRRNKRSFPWVVEEYAFGAAALKDEIIRHKKDDEKRWSIWKAIGIRLLYIYAVIGTLALVGIGLIWQRIQRFKR